MCTVHTGMEIERLVDGNGSPYRQTDITLLTYSEIVLRRTHTRKEIIVRICQLLVHSSLNITRWNQTEAGKTKPARQY